MSSRTVQIQLLIKLEENKITSLEQSIRNSEHILDEMRSARNAFKHIQMEYEGTRMPSSPINALLSIVHENLSGVEAIKDSVSATFNGVKEAELASSMHATVAILRQRIEVERENIHRDRCIIADILCNIEILNSKLLDSLFAEEIQP